MLSKARLPETVVSENFLAHEIYRKLILEYESVYGNLFPLGYQYMIIYIFPSIILVIQKDITHTSWI